MYEGILVRWGKKLGRTVRVQEVRQQTWLMWFPDPSRQPDHITHRGGWGQHTAAAQWRARNPLYWKPFKVMFTRPFEPCFRSGGGTDQQGGQSGDLMNQTELASQGAALFKTRSSTERLLRMPLILRVISRIRLWFKLNSRSRLWIQKPTNKFLIKSLCNYIFSMIFCFSKSA